jgi:hypothetical protein
MMQLKISQLSLQMVMMTIGGIIAEAIHQVGKMV